jgi:hypothetical protein
MAEDAEGAAGAAPGAGAGDEEEEDMAAARRGRRCRARWWEERSGDLEAAAAAQREERERARDPPMAGVKYGARPRGAVRWPSGNAGVEVVVVVVVEGREISASRARAGWPRLRADPRLGYGAVVFAQNNADVAQPQGCHTFSSN